MSGGRVDLGLGAGWFEAEHTAYGLPFPGTRERFDRLDEQLAVITGMWRTPVGETFSYDGDHYVVADSPALPKPVTPNGPPIIVGGHGKRRTPRLAARYAAEFNVGFSSADVVGDRFVRVREACDTARRDPDELVYSAALTVCCGRDDAEVRRRAEAIGREVDELRESGVVGTQGECVETIGRYASIGTERVYLQVLDLHDLDHLDLVAAEVMPKL